MAHIDQLLNLIGVVLWLSWRGVGDSSPATLGAGTLVSTLKPARREPTHSWMYLAALVGLLAVRPMLYAPLARALDWTPILPLGPVNLAFRADEPLRLLTFSVLSFGWTLLAFQAAVSALSQLARGPGEPTGVVRWLRELAGRPGAWPVAVSLVAPVLLVAAAWAALAFPLAQLGVLPVPPTGANLAGQAFAVGSGVWLPTRWVLAGLLLLRMVHDHVYLGDHPIWAYVRIAGGRLARPLAWLPLRLMKFDLTPLVAAVAVLALAEAAEAGLTRAYLMLSR